MPYSDNFTGRIFDKFDPLTSPFPAPSAGILDQPTYCMVINVEYVPVVLGVLMRLYWRDAWQGSEADKERCVSEVQGIAMSACCDYTLLESEGNLQLLEDGQVVSSVPLPVGPVGPAGPVGPVGPAGPVGPVGPAGESNEGVPETPPTQDNQKCGAAFYVAGQLETLIVDTYDDAQTITFVEWLQAVTGLGGWRYSPLGLLWDYIVANFTSSTKTDAQNATGTIAEALYCSNFDRDEFDAQVNDGTLSADVKAAYIAALDATSDDKLALWIAIGSNDTSQDCSVFDCPTWEYEWDFTNGDGGFVAKNIYSPSSPSTPFCRPTTDANYNGTEWVVDHGAAIKDFGAPVDIDSYTAWFSKQQANEKSFVFVVDQPGDQLREGIVNKPDSGVREAINQTSCDGIAIGSCDVLDKATLFSKLRISGSGPKPTGLTGGTFL